MTQEQIEIFGRGYDEGYWQGFGDAIKLALELISRADSKYILEPHKPYLTASLQLRAKSVLQKKKMLPYAHDVIIGKAENKKAPWED